MKENNRRNRISVLVVEDHSVVRWAINNYLHDNGMNIIGEASCTQEALDLAVTLKPQVVVMDILLGEESGIEATRELVRRTASRVMAYTAYDSRDCLKAFMDAGGRGFVSKMSPVSELVAGINATANDRMWVSPRLNRGSLTKHTDSAQKTPLSRREREVAVLIAKGLSSRQIAERLYVSLKTIQTHRYNIFKKLDVHNRAQLVDYVTKSNLMDGLRLFPKP